MSEFKYPPQGTTAGTVIGPGSSTDNAVARFNGTTGESVQNSGVIIDDSNNMTGIASAEVTGDVTVFNGTNRELNVGQEVYEMVSTSVSSFSGFTNNTTTFDIGAGSGRIIDHPTNHYYAVTWSAITGLSPLTSNGVTYVYIESDGTEYLTTTAPTPNARRARMLLGRVNTVGGNIVTIQAMIQIAEDVSNGLADLAYAIRIFNSTGNQITANGANLRINKSAGTLFSYGANYLSDIDNPHQVDIASATQATFAYITQSAGSTGASTQDVVPGSYDVGGTVTAIGGSSNQATVQRIYLFPSGNIRIAYGQTVYSSLANAIQGISSENFTENPSIAGNGVLIGLLVVTKGCTALNNTTTARILPVSRFGEAAVGGAGVSTSSLQNAYDNSTDPEILTDTTRGAVSIRRGSAADTDNVLEVQNNAGTNKFTVKGNGNVDIQGNTTFAGTVDLTTTKIAEGTNLYYTDERAQDAVGTILTDTDDIDFTYNDGANTITAALKSTAINAKTEVIADVADFVMISDTSDSGNLKKADLGDFLLTTATQTATNKTFTSPSMTAPAITDYAVFTESSAPAAPASGKIAIYAKSDKKMYKKDSNGTESELGAGGTTLINYMGNYDFETGATTGWATYKDSGATPTDGTGGSPTTLTLSANSSSPLRGSYDFKVAKSAANSQGEGWSYDFTIKVPDKSKKLSISFDLNTTDSNYTAGDVVIYVYDVTNATLITPSSTSLPKMSGTHMVTFDSTTSTSYRLIFHWAVTTASAANLYFDNIVVGPGQLVQGAAVGTWQTWTPGTITNLTPGNGTVTSLYRQDTDEVEFFYAITFGSTTSISGALTVPLPNSWTADSTKIPSSGNYTIGQSTFEDSGTNTFYGRVLYANGSILVYAMDDGTNAVAVASISGSLPFTWGTGDKLSFRFRLPISQLAGYGSVNFGAGAQVEYAYNSSTSTSASDTSSFAYGPAGATIQNITATLRRRVRFQYPIQQGDMIVLEISTDGGATWNEHINRTTNAALSSSIMGVIRENSTVYGAGVEVYVNTTDVDVLFGTYANMDGKTTVGGAGEAWSVAAGSWKWRVRKAKASAPVGFGLASSTASGLVSAETSGTFTASMSGGFTSNPADQTYYYARVGKLVTIWHQQQIGTSNATTNITVSGLPSAITPTSNVRSQTIGYDNSTAKMVTVSINSAGTLTVYAGLDVPNAATGSGSKGLLNGSFTYLLP